MILFDGATGTYFKELTGLDIVPEFGNITQRDAVYRIHRAYIEAGCDAIKTNTFAACDMLGHSRRQIIEAAYSIAKAASGGSTRVFADIGGTNPGEDAEYTYLENAKVFVTLGCKDYLFETLADIEDAAPAIKYVNENVQDAQIIVSFAADADGYTTKGRYYKNQIKAALELEGVKYAGLNCVSGPLHIYKLLSDITDRSRLTAMPNAGYPSYENGRLNYHTSEDYFAQKMCDIANLGITVLGGCCGTQPGHIRATRAAVANKTQAFVKQSKEADEPAVNSVREVINSDKRVLAFELDCPTGSSSESLERAFEAYSSLGADIISLTDSPLARARADSFVMAAYLQNRYSVNIMPHLTCRDKNHIGSRASVCAASICGIRSVLAVTGDGIGTGQDMRKGSETHNSFKLISAIGEINESILKNKDVLVAAALNVNAQNFDKELERALKKQSYGAEMLVTQAIYDQNAVDNLKKANQALSVPILAGIMPPASYKNAVFMNNEVKGITISREIIEALKDKTPQEVYGISADFSIDIMQKCLPYCKGFMFMTPLGKYDLIVHLVNEARNRKII